jgi:2,5-diketo-D-gluconate reductase A
VSTWKTLIEFVEDGRAKAVGVSNFQVAHLERLAAETDVVPAVNQIEAHPYVLNDEVRAYGRRTASSPRPGRPSRRARCSTTRSVVEVAEAVGRTPAQAVLRWHVQRGDIVFPKSTTPSRMRRTSRCSTSSSTDAQMQALSALDRGEAGRTGPNPDTFDYVPD